MIDFEKALVRVRQGWLQGYTEGGLKIFKGIPYAAPPVGELRFRRPQEPACWRGVRRAVQYPAAAVRHVMDQPGLPANTHGVPQALAPSQYEEDCLYLNIWTPAKTLVHCLPRFTPKSGKDQAKRFLHSNAWAAGTESILQFHRGMPEIAM